jgi:hypothetical protein
MAIIHQLFSVNLEDELQSFSLQQNTVPSGIEPLSQDDEHPFSTFLLLSTYFYRFLERI